MSKIREVIKKVIKLKNRGGTEERGGTKKIGRKCRNIMSKMWVKKRIQGIEWFDWRKTGNSGICLNNKTDIKRRRDVSTK